jgi:hypothetical protein
MSNFYGRQWEIKIRDPKEENPQEKVFIAAVNLYPEKLGERESALEWKATFNILVDFGGFTSYADIAIYNLSTDTANNVIKKGIEISLTAGYQDNYGVIFTGNVNNVLYERNGADTVTRIIARGGKLADAQSINKTMPKNSKVTDIIRELVKAMNYEIIINDKDFEKENIYIRPKVLNGDPRVQLDNLAQTHKFSYTFDVNNKIVVVKNDSKKKGLPVVLSQFTGMEGIPEITEVGVDVVSRLNPAITIGGEVDIQSNLKTFNFSNLYFQDIPPAAGTGIYRIFKLRHSGDTWGDDWTTKITGYR